MVNTATLWQNVNTVQDRKGVVSNVIKQLLPQGKVCIFLFHSFWHSLYFYNLFKKKYKKIIRLHPKYISQLKSINFSDYYTFLKLVVSTDKMPDNIHCLIFDLDLLMQSKYFIMYKILCETGLKFSFSLSSIASTLDYEKHIKFDKVVTTKSNFNAKINFKSIDNFAIPENSVFFCLNKNLLYTIAKKGCNLA